MRASNGLVSYLQLHAKANIAEAVKYDNMESDDVRDYQMPDAGVGSGEGGHPGKGDHAEGQCQKGYFARVITTDLIHTLTSFFVGAFSRHISEVISPTTVDAIGAQIQNHLATETSDRLAKTLSDLHLQFQQQLKLSQRDHVQ